MDYTITSSFLSTLQAANYGLNFSSYKPLYSTTPPPVVTTYPVGYYSTPKDAPTPDNNTPGTASAQVLRSWYNDPVNFVWDDNAKLFRSFALSTNVYNSPDGATTTWQELVSADLLTWTPYRFIFDIPHTSGQDLWGGSFLIDEKGTAGYSPGAVLYFISRPSSDRGSGQCISLWVSPYLGAKPVFASYILYPPPVGQNGMEAGSGFRDMRVCRNPDDTGWIAGITIDYGIAIYAATDPNVWTYLGVIDLSIYQQIECPSFGNIKDEQGNSKWFMFFGMKTYNGAYQQCVAYIPVTWNGTTFVPDSLVPTIVNWGHDWYAQAESAYNDDLYLQAWVGDWNYNGSLFTQGFSGVISNVVKTFLKTELDGSKKVGIKFLEGQTNKYSTSKILVPYGFYPLTSAAVWKGDIPTPGISWRVDFTITPDSIYGWPDKLHFDFCVAYNADYTNDNGFDRSRLTLDFANGTAYFDRSRCGNSPLNLADTNMQTLWNIVRQAPMPARARYQVTVIFDVCFAEILINDGDVFLTSLTMPLVVSDRDMYFVCEGSGQANLTRFTFRQ